MIDPQMFTCKGLDPDGRVILETANGDRYYISNDENGDQYVTFPDGKRVQLSGSNPQYQQAVSPFQLGGGAPPGEFCIGFDPAKPNADYTAAVVSNGSYSVPVPSDMLEKIIERLEVMGWDTRKANPEWERDKEAVVLAYQLQGLLKHFKPPREQPVQPNWSGPINAVEDSPHFHGDEPS